MIAKTAKPRVEAEAIGAPARGHLGFLVGEIEIPKDFDSMGKCEIERMFRCERD